MSSSSQRSTRNRGGTLVGEGDPPITGAPATTLLGTTRFGSYYLFSFLDNRMRLQLVRFSLDWVSQSLLQRCWAEPTCARLFRKCYDIRRSYSKDKVVSSKWSCGTVRRSPPFWGTLQPPPVDWEWLVVREDATANAAWTGSLLMRNFATVWSKPVYFILSSSQGLQICFETLRLCGSWSEDGVRLHILFYLLTIVTIVMFMFIFSSLHGELTVTLEDVENHWMLPILGDQDLAEVKLSLSELKVEAALANYIGRKNISLGTQAVRFAPWMDHFKREEDASIRGAAFVTYWLNKRVFAIYSDLFHAEELVGLSCHTVAIAFNSSVVHTFLWEHALDYITKSGVESL
uniref:Aminotransferase-like plant mobile domain-containing protein n=1 Tax=Fagus sylvatica TaxID=28930 RepID=A0A2N9EYG9_FAGSY